MTFLYIKSLCFFPVVVKQAALPLKPEQDKPQMARKM
jgi:hypothetical protein